MTGTTRTVVDEMLALEPERLLFTAREAMDLRLLPDDRLQDVEQRRLPFTWRGQAIVLRLNAHTMLPTAIDVTADDGTDIWGEVTTRVVFSYWNLEANGLLYPRQRNVLWNGYPQSEQSIVALTINPPVDASTFDVPADSGTAPRPGFRTSSDFFILAYLADLEMSMHRAGIASVDTIFGMHLRATPWSAIEAVLSRARPTP